MPDIAITKMETVTPEVEPPKQVKTPKKSKSKKKGKKKGSRKLQKGQGETSSDMDSKDSQENPVDRIEVSHFKMFTSRGQKTFKKE